MSGTPQPQSWMMQPRGLSYAPTPAGPNVPQERNMGGDATNPQTAQPANAGPTAPANGQMMTPAMKQNMAWGGNYAPGLFPWQQPQMGSPGPGMPRK